MGVPHVLVVPYPAQGHILPLMELSLHLAQSGIRVTFVNTDYNHNKVVKALGDAGHSLGGKIQLASIPDGLQPEDDRNDLGKLVEGILTVMPQKLEGLIKEINASGRDEISCVVADFGMGRILQVAEKIEIKRASFCPTAVSMLASILCIPNLIEDRVIDENGTLLKAEMIKLSPGMPAINPADFAWARMGSSVSKKVVFDLSRMNAGFLKLADWIVGNSTYDLEPAAFPLAPNLRPIGPLVASSDRQGSSAGYLWSEDLSCLNWLDQQAPSSVIYVAFGSFAVLDRTQFHELAVGLELTDRPFLWVVRPDITKAADEAYPEGFLERISNRGRITNWAPQQKVLSHPAIACFLSHCGWNSTMEGVSNGVPFLCWPYFADQLYNEIYICDVWKTGVGFSKDANGIISRLEIVAKVEKLLADEGYKERAAELKDKTISIKEGGSSYENFNKFIEWIKT